MKTLARLTYLALLSSLLFQPLPGQAEQVLIDFEDQSVQTTTQLVIDAPKENPKITVTISRSGVAFAIANLNLNDGSFKSRSLGPGVNPSSTQYVAEFSVPVSAVTLEVGDANSDFDNVFVWAYSENGDLLQSKNVTCCGNSVFNSSSITLEADGIKYIKFIGGSFFSPDSVYYDNLHLTFENQVVDTDNDGVADNLDTCPNSDLSPTVTIDGCVTEVANTIWESGCTTKDFYMACSNNARHHGDFVNCAKDFSKNIEKLGYITDEEQTDLQSCAAQASLP